MLPVTTWSIPPCLAAEIVKGTEKTQVQRLLWTPRMTLTLPAGRELLTFQQRRTPFNSTRVVGAVTGRTASSRSLTGRPRNSCIRATLGAEHQTIMLMALLWTLLAML